MLGYSGERICRQCHRSFDDILQKCPICFPDSAQTRWRRDVDNTSIAVARTAIAPRIEKVSSRLLRCGAVIYFVLICLVASYLKPSGWTAAGWVAAFVVLAFAGVALSFALPEGFYNSLLDLDVHGGRAEVSRGAVEGRWKKLPSGAVISFLALLFSFLWNLVVAATKASIHSGHISLAEVTAETVEEHYETEGEGGSYWDLEEEEKADWEMSHPNDFEYFISVAKQEFKVQVYEWFNVERGDVVQVHFLPYSRIVLAVDVLCRHRR
jgi:RNA polymerase subunit RPABC4/transcription elongation factor Spt4